MTTDEWTLSDEQRADTVSRIRTNISSMAFFRGAPQPPEAVAAAAAAIERKAYTVARVEARTTTGMRPHHETLKARAASSPARPRPPSGACSPCPSGASARPADGVCALAMIPPQAYVRKLSALVLETVAAGAAAAGPALTAGGTELDLTGSREFLTKESAEELLAPMLAPGAAVTSIRFSTKSFGAAAAEVAAAAIRNVAHTLRDADLSDIIAGRPEDEALAALRIIAGALQSARLRHLNLSDNALGEKGIRAAAAAFAHQEALESLAFQNVGCSVHGCAALEELLVSTHALRRLHLYNNMSGDEGAAHVARLLARCPSMEDFRMVSSRVGAAGGAALAAALAAAGSSLLRLDVHDNPMTQAAAGPLCAVLAAHPRLQHLNLNDTCLGDEGVAEVAAALPPCVAGLQELELALNEVTAAGAGAVAAGVRGKAALARLNLRENELEDEGAVAVAAVSAHTRACCGTSMPPSLALSSPPRGCRAAFRASACPAAPRLRPSSPLPLPLCFHPQGLAGLASLRFLDLTTNMIGRGGACAVAKAVAALPALERLELDDNQISEAGLEALRNILLAGGKLAALGSLEENLADEDGGEDGGEEGAEAADADVDALAAALQGEHL
jgi:large subunit ribosomal protein L31/Ran GTPase-activating protein 1